MLTSLDEFDQQEGVTNFYFRVVDFHYQTCLNQSLIKGFVTCRPRAANVTTIDLTSCYWLTSSFIRTLIGKLTQVENVLVADTALLPNHLKQLLQTLSRVGIFFFFFNFTFIIRNVTDQLINSLN